MLFTAVLFSALASLVAADFSIATPPSLVQCQPVSISWTDGTAPFILSAIPEGQISAEPLKYIKEGIQSSPYTWVVDLPAGTALNIKIVDGTGAYQFTSGLTIQKGSSDDCMKAAASSAAAPSEAPAATSDAPAATSDAPAATSEAPAQTSEAPAASSQAPAQTSEAPASATSVAPGGAVSASSKAPAASSTKPAASSAAPAPATSSNSGAQGLVAAVPAVAAAVAGALLF